MNVRQESSAREDVVSGLPDDLEDLVLARLPVSALYKARTVCKRWHSLLAHQPFLKLRNEIRGLQDAAFFPLVFWNDVKGNAIPPPPERRMSRFNMETQHAREPLSAHPGTDTGKAQSQQTTWSWLGYDSAMRKWQGMKPFRTPFDVKNVITGTKGLLCLRGDDCLLVVNPMTGARRELPLKENVVQLVVHSELNSFKIICAGSRKRTKIYDSETGLWSKRGRPVPNLALSRHIGAFCDGVYYCVAREERSGMLGAVGYTVEGDRTWSDVIFFPSQVGETCLKAKIIEFGGDVFALLEKEISEDDIGPRTKSLSFWILERTSMKWRLAGTMPPQSRQHLINLDDFDGVALGNRICIFNKSTFKAVDCFISNGIVTSWQHLLLDSYFSADVPQTERFIVQFAFEPSLLLSI